MTEKTCVIELCTIVFVFNVSIGDMMYICAPKCDSLNITDIVSVI